VIHGFVPDLLAFSSRRITPGVHPNGAGEAAYVDLPEAAFLQFPAELNRVLREKFSEGARLVEMKEEREVMRRVTNQLRIVEGKFKKAAFPENPLSFI
jgi:hypothetical protein